MSGKKDKPDNRGTDGRDALAGAGSQQRRSGSGSASNARANYRSASNSPPRQGRALDGQNTPSSDFPRQQQQARTQQPQQRIQVPGHRNAVVPSQEHTPTSSGANQRMSRRDLYSTNYGPSSSSPDTSYDESAAEVSDEQGKPPKKKPREPRTEAPPRNPMPQGGADAGAMSSADEEDMDVDTESNVGATGGQERNIVHRQPKWTEDENMALAHAAHEDSDPLRNRFQGGSGGKDRKKAAWARVARAVNVVSKCGRSVKECYKKLGYLQSAAKKKNLELRRRYSRSGAGGIPKKEQLTELDRLVLSFMGEEPVSGIPGLAPTPLVRVTESELVARGGSAQPGGANRRRNTPSRSDSQNNQRNPARTPRSATVTRPDSSSSLPASEPRPANTHGSGFIDFMTPNTDDSAMEGVAEADTNVAIDEVNTIEIDDDFNVSGVAALEPATAAPRDRALREPFQFVQAAEDNLRELHHDQTLPDVADAAPLPVDGPGPNEFHLQELTPDGAGNVQPFGPVVSGTLPSDEAGGRKYTQGPMSLSQVFQSLLSRPAEEIQPAAEGMAEEMAEEMAEGMGDSIVPNMPAPGGMEMTLDDVLSSVQLEPPPNSATNPPLMATDQGSVNGQQSDTVPPAPQPPLPFHTGFGRELLQQLDQHFGHNGRLFERMVNMQERLTEQVTAGFGRELLQQLEQQFQQNGQMFLRMLNMQERLTTVSANLVEGLCTVQQNAASPPRSIMTQTDVTYINNFGQDAAMPQQDDVHIVAITDVTEGSVDIVQLPGTETTARSNGSPANNGEPHAVVEPSTDQATGSEHDVVIETVAETAAEVLLLVQGARGNGDGDSAAVQQASAISDPADEVGTPKTSVAEASTSSASKPATGGKSTPDASGDSRVPPATVPRFGRPCTRQRQPRRAYSLSKSYAPTFKKD